MLHTADAIRTATVDAAKQMIRDNLASSELWLARALIALLRRQTSDEIASQQTRHSNDRGFNATDAEILTSFAQQAQGWLETPPAQRRFPNPLSPRQLILARKKMIKYAGQLARIARGKPVEELAVAVA